MLRQFANLLKKLLPQDMKKARLHPQMLKPKASHVVWAAEVELEALLDCKLAGIER